MKIKLQTQISNEKKREKIPYYHQMTESIKEKVSTGVVGITTLYNKITE